MKTHRSKADIFRNESGLLPQVTFSLGSFQPDDEDLNRQHPRGPLSKKQRVDSPPNPKAHGIGEAIVKKSIPCIMPTSALSGAILCGWFFSGNWGNGGLITKSLVLVALLSPAVFLTFFHRKAAIESWAIRTRGGSVIFLFLWLWSIVGGLVSLVGGMTLMLAVAGLLCLAVAEGVKLLK